MGHLVWWISPDEESEDSSYSVVPQNGFLSYEEGKKKGYHELPSNMRRLLEKGKPFNPKQEEIAGCLTMLNELALQEPEDREHPRIHFSEEDFWGMDDDEIAAAGDGGGGVSGNVTLTHGHTHRHPLV